MKVPGAERAHVKLKDLHPNPFRHIEAYPIRPHKVEELVRSIKRNNWWQNVHARPRKKGGGYEIAYGHHRLAALRKLYKPTDEVQMMVAPLTDEQMLRFMIDENLEENGGDALTEMYAVAAVIEAHEKGIITLTSRDSTPGEKNRQLRRPVGRLSAREEMRSDTGGPHGLKLAVAEFLGWTRDNGSWIGLTVRAEVAYGAWQLASDKKLDLKQLFKVELAAGAVINRHAMSAAVETAMRVQRAVQREVSQRSKEAEAARKQNDERTAARIEAEIERLKEEERKQIKREAVAAARDVASGERSISDVRRDLRKDPPIPRAKLRKRTVSATGWLKAVKDFLTDIAGHDFFDSEMDHILEVVDDPNIVTPYDRKQLLAAFERALAKINERWTKHIERLRKVTSEHEPQVKNVTPIRKALT